MAQAITNTLYGDRFHAFSAGSRAEPGKYPDTAGIHPLALTTLNRNHIPSEGLLSRNWEEFISGAWSLDFVFTLCGDSLSDLEEFCPIFPGQPLSAHWGVGDPLMFEGNREQEERVFQDTFLVIKRRIELFASLPLDSLDAFSLKKSMEDIGRD